MRRLRVAISVLRLNNEVFRLSAYRAVGWGGEHAYFDAVRPALLVEAIVRCNLRLYAGLDGRLHAALLRGGRNAYETAHDDE